MKVAISSCEWHRFWIKCPTFFVAQDRFSRRSVTANHGTHGRTWLTLITTFSGFIKAREKRKKGKRKGRGRNRTPIEKHRPKAFFPNTISKKKTTGGRNRYRNQREQGPRTGDKNGEAGNETGRTNRGKRTGLGNPGDTKRTQAEESHRDRCYCLRRFQNQERKQRKAEEGAEERRQCRPARASPSSPSTPADQVSTFFFSHYFSWHLHCASEF